MLHKVFPDKEKAKSILKMAINREKSINSINIEYPTIIAENYYEIIKELSSALLLIDGFKAIGENVHKEIIDRLSKFSFSDYDISIMQDLRVKRNKSQYEGEPFDDSYLKFRKDILIKFMDKLKKLIEDRLK